MQKNEETMHLTFRGHHGQRHGLQTRAPFSSGFLLDIRVMVNVKGN